MLCANERNTMRKKKRLNCYVLLVVILVTVGIALGITLPNVWRKAQPGDKPFESILGNFSKAAVATDARECAVVGKDVLVRGGSAADAAIATLLCMGVVIPHSMGIGGGFLMTIYNKETGTVRVLDAREVAPGKSTADMFKEQPLNKRVGGLSVAVPGELRGYQKLHEEYGRLPWSELFKPAIKLAKHGFPVGSHLSRAIQLFEKKLDDFPNLRKLLTNPDTKDFYKKDELMKNENLASVLELISATNNADEFYKGSIAQILIKEIQANGGIMTLKDLSNYQARWLDPVQVSLKSRSNLTLYSVPPPGSGAILSMILNIIAQYDPTFETFQSDQALTIHRLIEAYKFAYAKRTWLEDGYDSKLIKNITSDAYARWARSLINDESTHHNPSYYGGGVDIIRDHGTAHVSVLAPNGDAVAASSTINIYFGSRLLTSNGIILNDEMDDFNSPNITNSFGVPPSGANLIKPGSRPISSMAPTIVLDENGYVRLVIGGSGGTQITTGIASVMFCSIWLDQDVKTCIDTPRIHHQLYPNRTIFENTVSQATLKGLERRGHILLELRGRGAVIEAITRGTDGRLLANADYRKEGNVDGF